MTPYSPEAHGALCSRCVLHDMRDGDPVPPEINPGAIALLVGERPGRDEARHLRPFVGRAGEELQRALVPLGIQRGHVSIDNAIACLKYDSVVYLEGWKREWIGKLVGSQYSGKVMSVDSEGQIGARRVIGWHKSQLAGRELLKIRTRYSKRSRVGTPGPTVTADHLILTRRGWVAAGDLASTDFVATGEVELLAGTPAYDVFVGTMLGDSGIQRSRLAVSHKRDNEDYVRVKARALAALGATPVVLQRVSRAGAQDHFCFSAPANAWLRYQRDRFYGGDMPKWCSQSFGVGRKVPRDLSLSPLSLAVWFMDDGSLNLRDAKRQPNAELTTCRYSREDVDFLQRRIFEDFGIETTTTFNHGWRIKFGVRATERVSQVISPFVPNSMQYKLLPKHRGRYKQDLYDGGRPGVFYDNAVVLPANNGAFGNNVYCIDVEDTHNFITTTAVVHNCQPIGGQMGLVEARLAKVNAERAAQGVEPLLHPVDACRPRLLRVVREHAVRGVPNVVALGKAAVESLTGITKPIGEVRGGPIEGVLDLNDAFHVERQRPPGGTEGSILDFVPGTRLRILPTFNPAFVGRKKRWRSTLASDMGKALRWFRGELQWRNPPTLYVPSPEQLWEFLSASSPHWAADFETDDLEPMWAKIRCIGIARQGPNGPECVVIPLNGIDGHSRFYTPPVEAEVWRLVCLFLSSERWLKSFWNFYYDGQVAKTQLGVEVRNYVDGILLAKNVASELPKTLAYTGSVHTDVTAWKSSHTAITAKTDFELWQYNSIDIAVTLLVIEPLWRALQARQHQIEVNERRRVATGRPARSYPTQAAVVDLDHRLQSWCVGLHENGLWVDQERRARWDKDLLVKARAAVKNLRALAGDPRFGKGKHKDPLNPNSPHQIREIVFNRWGLPPREFTDSGAASVSDDTIRAFMRDKSLKEEQREFFRQLRWARRWTKYRGTFVNPVRTPGTPIEALDLDFNEDRELTEDMVAKGDKAAWLRVQEIRAELRRKAVGKSNKDAKASILFGDGRVRGHWSAHSVVSGRLASSEPNCFDGATEVLTREGWVRFDQLEKGNEVAQWDNGVVTFVRPTGYVTYVSDKPLVEIENQHITLRVTEDHRCPVRYRLPRDGGEVLRVYPAAEYPTQNAKQIHAGTYSGRGLRLTQPEMALIVATQADGSWTKHGIDFSFKKKRKIERFRDILRGLTDVEYSDRPGSKGQTRFLVRGPVVDRVRSFLGNAKAFGPWLLDASRKELDWFCEEIFHWDGSFARKNNYASSDKTNADWVQVVFSLSGMRARYRCYTPAEGAWGKRPSHQIDITRRDSSWTTNINVRRAAVVGERVYCVSVPSSYIVVRRGQNVMVTGQCQNIPSILRDIYAAARGRVLVYADMDQLELRIGANLAGARAYIEVFRQNGDPHALTAEMVFGAVFHNADKDDKKRMRDFAKRHGFACLYGAQPETILEVITSVENRKGELVYADLKLEQARERRARWLAANPEIEQWWRWQKDEFREQGYLQEYVGGRRRDFLDLDNENEWVNFADQASGASAVNFATRDLVDGVGAPLAFQRWGPGTGLVQQGHDALMFEVPLDSIEGYRPGDRIVPPQAYRTAIAAAKAMQEAMTRTIPGWPVPLTASAKVILCDDTGLSRWSNAGDDTLAISPWKLEKMLDGKAA